MANTNVAFGLKPINTAGSTPATGGVNAYPIGSSAALLIPTEVTDCDVEILVAAFGGTFAKS